jgi:hypothetical protein
MEITVGDGNVQENLHRFLAAPEVQALFGALRPHVDNCPGPRADGRDALGDGDAGLAVEPREEPHGGLAVRPPSRFG